MTLILLLAMLAADAETPAKPLPPITLAAADAQRLQQLGAEQALLQERLKSIGLEADVIRYKTCAAASATPEECGNFTQGGVQRIAKPAPKKPEKEKP